MTFDLKAGNGWMFKSGRGRHEQIEVIVLDKMSAHGQARAAILRGRSPCKVKQLGLNTFYNVFQPTKIDRVATVSIYNFCHDDNYTLLRGVIHNQKLLSGRPSSVKELK